VTCHIDSKVAPSILRSRLSADRFRWRLYRRLSCYAGLRKSDRTIRGLNFERTNRTHCADARTTAVGKRICRLSGRDLRNKCEDR
jgi:hypothetical protein